jgi:uncharacterized protein (DUF3084 family)
MSTNEDAVVLKAENEKVKRELELAALNQKNCEARLEAANLAAQKVRRPWILQKESWAAIGAACLVMIPVYQQWKTADGKVVQARKDRDTAQGELSAALTDKTNALIEASGARDAAAKAKQEFQTIQASAAGAAQKLKDLTSQINDQQQRLDGINKSITRVSSQLTSAASQLRQAQTKIKQPQATAQDVSSFVNSALTSISDVEKEVGIIHPLLNFKPLIPVIIPR